MDGNFGDFASYELSSTMRSAFNANTQITHQLKKTVKILEADRDMKLLNLQIEKDEIHNLSPSFGRKLVKTPSQVSGSRSGTPVPKLGFNTVLHRDDVSRLQKYLKPQTLHLDQAGLIATPPRVRKTATMIERSSRESPNQFKTHSPLASPLTGRKNLTRFSSSPPMSLSGNPLQSSVARDGSYLKSLDQPKNKMCGKQGSPLVRGSNAESLAPRNSPAEFKLEQVTNQCGQIVHRPLTTAQISLGDREATHRGLLLRPVLSSKAQVKLKDIKENVFDRLYPNSKGSNIRFQHRDCSLHFGNLMLDEGRIRRRSLSLSDLPELLDED